jgi:FkbM family methyltransferase
MHASEFVYTALLKPRILRRAANAVIKFLLPKTVTVGDAIIWINPNDPVVSGALRFRVYERSEISFFRSRFISDMTLIDVGANVGLYTGVALSRKGFNGVVLALEPHRESREFLQRTIASNRVTNQQGKVIVSDIAASDRAGSATFYKNSQNKGDNRIYPDPLLDEEEVIATDTLDNICQQHGIDSVQFLKIDVQGAEAKVVGGAARLLQRSADCIVMTEFWPYGLSRSGSDALAYLESLGRLGFRLYELRSGSILPLDSPRALISKTQGRNYANLIGLKGRFCENRAQ